MVEERLSDSNIHWSSLCCYLTWPPAFIKTLNQQPTPPSSNNTSEKGDDEKDDQQLHSKRTLSLPDSIAVAWRKVIDHVRMCCPNDESHQLSLMLRLWLLHNGRSATIDQLFQAVRKAHLRRLTNTNLTEVPPLLSQKARATA